jgi:uncharacterized membrane protein YfhO
VAMRKNKKNWILYCRSFLLTVGISFILFSVWFAWLNYQRQELFSALPLMFLFGFIIVGFAVAYYGMHGPNSKIEKWAGIASNHWVSALLMLLAYPVYLLLLSRHERMKNA